VFAGGKHFAEMAHVITRLVLSAQKLGIFKHYEILGVTIFVQGGN
jgi:hypothetical protein